MDKEARQLFAWYANGTLTGTDRDRVEAALQKEAGATTLLDWESAIREAARGDPSFEVPADRGLDRVMERIRAEVKPKAAPPAAARRKSLSLPKWKFQWSPALAVAFGLVVVQFAVIVQMWQAANEQAEYAAVRAMEARRHAEAVFARILFKPDSTEGDLSTLLRTIHAEIVAGPSQLGDYYLLLQRQDAEDALSMLLNNAHVESAEIVKALPARP